MCYVTTRACGPKIELGTEMLGCESLMKIFFLGAMVLLMVATNDQPLVARRLLLEDTVQRPPAGRRAKQCWFLRRDRQ